jgi:hypothetical protein
LSEMPQERGGFEERLGPLFARGFDSATHARWAANRGLEKSGRPNEDARFQFRFTVPGPEAATQAPPPVSQASGPVTDAHVSFEYEGR